MSKLLALLFSFIFIAIFHLNGFSQEKYGSSLNLGLGIGGYSGYYKYTDRSLPVFHINYEFDVAKNFTIAPFISFSSYSDRTYWGQNKATYTYRHTVVPIGAKGTYYFDDLLQARSDWDFYLAGSLGFALLHSRWDDGYGGDRDLYSNGSPLFLDLHIGTEYHFNNRIGAFLDLSTGVSTIGIAIH